MKNQYFTEIEILKKFNISTYLDYLIIKNRRTLFFFNVIKLFQ